MTVFVIDSFIAREKSSSEESSEEEIVNDDTPCRRCGKYDNPEWVSCKKVKYLLPFLLTL